MENKRNDLQGIRGLAILAVLLFHFFPKIFPNGYVGVDQFFILSGFFMAKILAKESHISINGTMFFYFRRMKRIVSLYAIFILIILVSTLIMYEKRVFELNIGYALRSLLFISNFETADKNLDYERLLANADNLFTHTWSLSVEIQFYVIAPFIILTSLYISRLAFLTIMTLIFSLSFAAFAYFIYDDSRKKFAFYSMATRIWQFALGFMCLYMTNNNNNTDVSNSYGPSEPLLLIGKSSGCVPRSTQKVTAFCAFSACNVLITNSLLVLCNVTIFSFWVVPQLVLRLTVCISTTFLIYFGVFNENRFLSMRPLVYLGDISYALYLFHWPIFTFVKHNYESSIPAIFVGIVVSILVAIFFTKVYETFCLKQTKKQIISLCIALYLLNFSFIFAMRPIDAFIENSEDINIFWSKPANLTNDQIMALNLQFTKEDIPLLIKTENECELIRTIGGIKYCKFNNTEYKGSNRIMLVGNSYARNIARMLLKQKSCTAKSKDIYMYSSSTCEVLDDTTVHYKPCKGFNDASINAVNQTKPDYLFILTRHFVSMFPSNTSEDSILRKELEQIAILEKIVLRKIFILDAFPRTRTKGISILNSLNAAISRSERMPSNAELIDKTANYEIARKRMREIIKNCPKCELIDVMPIFTKNSIFQHYDENDKLIHFNYNLHFTDYALTKLQSMFTKICERI